MAKGLKCKVVQVNVKGRIDGACKGKNHWDDDIRSIALHALDVFTMHVMDRNLANMADLCGHMDKLYEYLNNELSIKRFEDNVH